MPMVSRRKRPLDRSIPHFRDSSLVVIATEGELTEKQYFELFRHKSSRVQIRVLETRDGRSAPKYVFERLRQFRQGFDLGPNDLLCLVVDYDRWGDAQLAEIASQARKLGFLLAVSRPCFELWLYLHHGEPGPELQEATSRQMKQALGQLLDGFDPSNLQATRFEPAVGLAVERARRLDTAPEDRWPQRLGSRVYRVIDGIVARHGPGEVDFG